MSSTRRPLQVEAQESAEDSREGPGLRKLGRYELLGELGRGAMGAVYRAYDPNVDREVAIKIMRPWMATRAEQAELQRRFLAEVRAAGRLKHPGVISVFDADRDPDTGLAFLAMELVDGCSLEEILQSLPRLEPELALEIAVQVADALDAAHREGIVHRDVKPENLLIDRRGMVKLSDFGIVRLDEEKFTQTGQVIGTPVYMSPEQLLGERIDAASDLWAFAVVLFRALTGETPFSSPSVGSLAYQIVHDPPRSAVEANPDLDERLATTLGRALDKEKEGRYPTALEIVADCGVEASSPRVRTVLGHLVQVVVSRRPAREGSAVSSPVSGELVPRLEGTPQASQVATRRSGGLAGRQRPLWQATSWLLVAAAFALLAAVVVLRWGPGESSAVLPGEVRAARVMPGSIASQDAALVGTGLSDEAATEEAAASTEAAAAEPARVRLHFRNRLRSSVVTLRVDGVVAWRRQLEGRRNFFRRVVGTPYSTTLEIPPGDREIEVEIQGQSMKVHGRSAIRAVLPDGSYRELVVSLNPYTERVSLEWK